MPEPPLTLVADVVAGAAEPVLPVMNPEMLVGATAPVSGLFGVTDVEGPVIPGEAADGVPCSAPIPPPWPDPPSFWHCCRTCWNGPYSLGSMFGMAARQSTHCLSGAVAFGFRQLLRGSIRTRHCSIPLSLLITFWQKPQHLPIADMSCGAILLVWAAVPATAGVSCAT